MSVLNIDDFYIFAQVRNNTDFSGENKLKIQAANIFYSVRPDWKVDLNDPQVTIGINVLQRAVCVSILADYNERAKYNLIEYTKKFSKTPEPEVEPGDNPLVKPSDTEQVVATQVEPVVENSENISKENSDSEEEVVQN